MAFRRADTPPYTETPTNLRLRNLSGVSVTERRNVQSHLPLLVSLLEELLHAPGRPLSVKLPVLGGVGHVHSVQQQTHHLRLLETGEGEV